MEDVIAMLATDLDFTKMDGNMLELSRDIYASLPEPPVATAVRLSSAAAARAPADGIDRISRLPVELLRSIVSHLPTKDAARTTVLSTPWRRVWHSVPLVLIDAHLIPRGAPGWAGRPPSLLDLLTAVPRDLTVPVTRALAAHPGPFRFVYLAGTPMDAHRPEVVLWLQGLAKKGVQQLIFVNRTSTLKIDHVQLPATLFRCTSLTRLYIGFWTFPDIAAVPRAAGFPCLRELGLCTVIMSKRDLAFLLDRCPVLEKLFIIGSLLPLYLRVQTPSLQCVEVCEGIVAEISVVHATRLERLLLWEAWGDGGYANMSSRVKIVHVPKLRVVGFLVPGMHQLEIGNTTIKAETKASPNTTVPSVQVLGFQVKLGTRIEAGMLPSFLRCFPNVETLHVQSENDDFKFWGGSRATEKIDLKFWEEAAPIECVQHHIKKLVLREFRGQTGEFNFLKFIAERAQVLQEMVIVMTHGLSPSDQVGAKLRTFMASAKWANGCCKLMILKSPFPGEGNVWCFLRGFDLSIKDPFDVSRCLEGKCQSHRRSVPVSTF